MIYDHPEFPRGTSVRYVGSVSHIKDCVGDVSYVDSRGWVHVRFRRNAEPISCAQSNLRPLELWQ